MSRERLDHLLQSMAKTADEISEEQRASRSEKLRKLAAAFEPTNTAFKVEPTAEEYKAEIALLRKTIKQLEDDVESYYHTSELGRRCTLQLIRQLPIPSIIINVDDLDLVPHTKLMKVTLMPDENGDWLGLESAD